MRSHSYLNSARTIIELYDGSMPLAAWLKNYFREHKKFGSKDRRYVAHLCYCYFRMGKAALALSIDDAIMNGLFLCSRESNEMLATLKPRLNEQAGSGLDEKFSVINHRIHLFDIFPWKEELSSEIDYAELCASFLTQPDLFLRIRPGNEAMVKQKLQNAGFAFSAISETCIGMPNSSKVEDVLQIDKEAVIQDFNSQKTLDSLNEILGSCEELKVWDCCAASGGKSILLWDKCSRVKLTLSDLRTRIISKLQDRFERAEIKSYLFMIQDAASESMNVKFDLVICDAPCTGSGTWSRTPEQLHFFKKEKISHYVDLQKRIVSNASKSVKVGGYFLYITCSVFEKENEEVVKHIENNTALQLLSMEYLKGYDKRADTLFTALFRL